MVPLRPETQQAPTMATHHLVPLPDLSVLNHEANENDTENFYRDSQVRGTPIPSMQRS